jgi:hypothetical protein
MMALSEYLKAPVQCLEDRRLEKIALVTGLSEASVIDGSIKLGYVVIPCPK